MHSPIQRDGNLTFEKPDLKTFPCLGYAFEAARKLGTMPAAMNAANDFIVESFLDRKCRFMDIPDIIKKVMDVHKTKQHPSLENIKSSIKKSEKLAKKFLDEKNE